MTDKEKIKQEIERLKHTSNAYDRSRFMLLLEIEDFINSLPEEPTSEDLEEYAKKLTKGAALDKHNLIWMCKKGAEWQKQKDQESSCETNCTSKSDDLEEELDNFLKDPVFGKLINRNAGLALASHFAEWGKTHK